MGFRSTDVKPYSKEQFLEDVFLDAESYDELCALLKRKKNLILQGAPGTGKSYAATRLAYSLMGATDDSCVKRVQFHQGSSYEDYIVGYKPTMDGGFAPEPGIFTEFFLEAAKDERQFENFYLIIDEINRANLSKVFGELLMLIESDHRGESLVVPGLEKPLTVPDNLYIIGMMNTADRGLALVDYALRRRFAFYTMNPALDTDKFKKAIEELGNPKLGLLVEAVRRLNDEIAKDPTLGPGFRIGHSYFCFRKKPTDADLKSIVNYELKPLLEEYWFDPSDQDKLKEQLESLEAAVR